jgi:pimeloyl-ACP methyl ester carboxylesterase
VPSDCPFDSPDTDHWDCSTLIVPADRAHPDGSHVLLPVAVLRSQAKDRMPDPIVFFSGGPGDANLASAGFWAEFAAGGRHDIILFDQRGTGGARPSLNCPEAEEAQRADIAAAEPDAVESGRDRAALVACRARLVERGIDLDDFDTPTTADDAEDLRRALGVRQWDVIGTSYGTTVALEVARRHAASIRSMVLDSVYTPDITQARTGVVASAARSFAAYFESCPRSPVCVTSHPDLRAEFNALVDSWNEQPFELDIDDPRGGDRPQLHVALDGDDLTTGLFRALYNITYIPVLPSVAAKIRPRDDAARALVTTFVVDALRESLFTSEGVQGVVNCADRQRIEAPTRDIDALTAATPSLRALVDQYDQCEVWDVASVPAAFNTVPRSKVRTLALAGDFDPITPPADTERVAARFDRSTFILFPAHGHAEVFADECPQSIVKAFIDDPTVAPDQSCVSPPGPPEYAAG